MFWGTILDGALSLRSFSSVLLLEHRSITDLIYLFIYFGFGSVTTEHLAMLRGPYVILGIRPRSAVCSPNALVTVLSLWPITDIFVF